MLFRSMFDSFINRSEFDSFLGKETLAIRSHFPKNWKNFIDAVNEISVSGYIKKSGNQDLKDVWAELIEFYFDQILGFHKRKVFGFITHAFKTGRNNTIGGFEGNTIVDGTSQVDTQLEASRMERLGGCPYASKILSQSKFCPVNKSDKMVCPHEFIEVSDVIENNGVNSEHYFVANQVVYDASSYLDQHPGGKTLIALCSGRDITNELARVSHLGPGYIKKKLDSFAIGVLKGRNFQRKDLQLLYESVRDFGYYLSEIEAIFHLEVSLLDREITSADMDLDGISEYKRDLFSGTNVRFVNEFIPGILKNLKKVGVQLNGLEECPEDILLQNSLQKVVGELGDSRLDQIVKSSYLGFDPEQMNNFQKARIETRALKDHIQSRYLLLAKSKDAAVNLLKILEQEDLEQNETLDFIQVQKMTDLFLNAAEGLMAKNI